MIAGIRVFRTMNASMRMPITSAKQIDLMTAESSTMNPGKTAVMIRAAAVTTTLRTADSVGPD